MSPKLAGFFLILIELLIRTDERLTSLQCKVDLLRCTSGEAILRAKESLLEEAGF